MTDRPAQRKLMLWAAQGFGAGWVPFAPGTVGSLLGFAWLAVLIALGSFWLLVLGSIAAAGVAVWLCDTAEKTLRQKDPGSVVLDEIVAVPVCLWGWMAFYCSQQGSMPALNQFFAWNNWPVIVSAFLAFRFFDILKPRPVRQSQALPGGWGVVIDDLLAAVYVNLLQLAALAAKIL